ncbi:TPA: type 1 fimbrial protein [Aeromonas hydrophila]|uniref:fimbrial protein n=1 Tax=Aeromonas TaxID=642 RepID=UPI0009C05ACF|nr:fimbrial protein [Aeromonas caviae]HDZ8915482.1 type 1 fimbrial protein [Aeromonas hydrophila]
MRKTALCAAVALSFCALSSIANATQINFTGVVTAKSCELVSNGDLDFNLSTVGISDVQEAGQQNGGMSLAAAVQCAGATAGTVTMSLMPIPGSFSGKVLKNIATTDAAKGVGFVVMNEKNELLDFSAGSAEITVPMSGSGTANVIIATNYAKDGSGDVVTAGNVNAVLPFVLTYE